MTLLSLWKMVREALLRTATIYLSIYKSYCLALICCGNTILAWYEILICIKAIDKLMPTIRAGIIIQYHELLWFIIISRVPRSEFNYMFPECNFSFMWWLETSIFCPMKPTKIFLLSFNWCLVPCPAGNWAFYYKWQKSALLRHVEGSTYWFQEITAALIKKATAYMHSGLCVSRLDGARAFTKERVTSFRCREYILFWKPNWQACCSENIHSLSRSRKGKPA